MSVALDVLDILDLDEPVSKKTILDKETLLARADKKKYTRANAPPKRPEHVPREVWGLHSTLNNNLPPIMPTDDTPIYKQPKAVIGLGRVRRWIWTPFTNSARKDNLVLYHWRRESSESETNNDYYFARYNKHVTIPEYTHEEYETLLKDPKWSEEKTAHLFELAKRFDLRFIHMRDRWDSEQFPGRPSIEDLKERYYGIVSQLDKVRGTNLCQGLRYDAAHERRRKQQLSLLYGRTKDQVEEEQRLVLELRKIEARRRERERKKQDLQKLISLAETITRESEPSEHSSSCFEFGTDDPTNGMQYSMGTPSLTSTTPNPNLVGIGQRKRTGASNSMMTGTQNSFYAHGTGDSCSSLISLNASGGGNSVGSTNDLSSTIQSASNTINSAINANYVINFVDVSKNPGVHLRSQKMKLPSNLGQKKIRIIENFLAHLQIDPNPPATAEIVEAYNNLRSKILLLFDLRIALLHCDYELYSARLRLETFAPNQPLPRSLVNLPNPNNSDPTESNNTHTNLIDSSILAALRVADSKRPLLPRHSLGIAGTLTAAGGSSGINLDETILSDKLNQKYCSSSMQNNNIHNSSQSNFNNSINDSILEENTRFSNRETLSSTVLTPSALTNKSSPSHSQSLINNTDDSDLIENSAGGSLRRKRAAAVEQARVLKKLKIKGQLLD